MKIVLVYLFAGMLALLASSCATTTVGKNCEKIAASGTPTADDDSISCVIDRDVVDSIRPCLKNLMLGGAAAGETGKTDVSFMILSDGSLLGAKFDPEPKDQEFKSCMITKIISNKFPARESARMVRFPLTYYAGGTLL